MSISGLHPLPHQQCDGGGGEEPEAALPVRALPPDAQEVGHKGRGHVWPVVPQTQNYCTVLNRHIHLLSATDCSTIIPTHALSPLICLNLCYLLIILQHCCYFVRLYTKSRGGSRIGASWPVDLCVKFFSATHAGSIVCRELSIFILIF